MKKIILLSGHSKRFIEKGYCIKPLIEIKNKKIIELAVESVYENEINYSDYIFVVKKTDITNYYIDDIITKIFPGCVVFPIEDHTLGPVWSSKQVYHLINESDEVVVCYCDLHIKWKFTEFLSFARSTNSDGVVATHSGWHPHRIYNNYFAYLRVDGDKVLELKEKEYFTNNPINEPASSGIYYFKSKAIFTKYLDNLIKFDMKVKGEFYMTMPYNLMINEGLKVTHYKSDNYMCLGTPKDIEVIKGCYLLLDNLEITDINEDLFKYFKTGFY